MRKQISMQNTARGTTARLLLEQADGRLSGRQKREAPKKLAAPGRLSGRQKREALGKLACPGYSPQGLLGEWPLIQRPPEWDEAFVVVVVGDHSGWNRGNTPRWSNHYFVPVGSVEALLVRHGLSVEEWLAQPWLAIRTRDVRDEVAAAVRAASSGGRMAA